MIKAEEMKQITDKCKLNLKACNELYEEEIIKHFSTKYKRDIKKFERAIKNQSKKGIYYIIVSKKIKNSFEAQAYKKGLINYYKNLGYEVRAVISESSYDCLVQSRKVVIEISWGGKD